jgi:hypothetical protein
VHDLFLDGSQFVALHVLKSQVLSQAKCLAIDKKDALTQGILNPVIISTCYKLLLHAIAMTPLSISLTHWSRFSWLLWFSCMSPSYRVMLSFYT